MPYYIIDSQSGEQIEVDEEVYRAWAADNNITTTQGDPVVGGVNKTSVSSTGSVTGSSTIAQPGSGTGSTLYLKAAAIPGSEYTAEQRRAAQADRERVEAIARANAIWAGFRAIAGLRGYQQLDGGGGGGGYPEPIVDDPYSNEDFVEPGYFDDGPGDVIDDPSAVVYNAPEGGPGIDDAFDIDPRTDAQVAADDAAIAAATGIRINDNNVADDPFGPTGTAAGGPGIDDTFAGDTRTPEQIAADNRAIEIATGVRITDPGSVEVASNNLTQDQRNSLISQLDKTYENVLLTAPNTNDISTIENRIASIETLLSAQDNPEIGRLFTAAENAELRNQLSADTARLNFINQTLDVANQIIVEAGDLAGAITDTGTSASRQLITDYLASLSSTELEILQQDPAISRNLLSVSGVDFPLYNEGGTVPTPYSGQPGPTSVYDETLNAAVAEWISQNGSISESEYNAIADRVAQETRVQQSEALPTFRVNDAERDPDTGGQLFRTSASTTVSSGDTNVVLTGNDTPPPVFGPGLPTNAAPDAVPLALVPSLVAGPTLVTRAAAEVTDTRTPAQIAADDAAILAATGVRVINPDPGVDPRTPAQIAADDAAIARATSVNQTSARTVGGNFTEVFNEGTGSYDVINLDTGVTVATGLTEQQAILEAQNASIGDPSYGSLTQATQSTPSASQIKTGPQPVGGNFTEVYNPETGLYDVVNLDTGATVATGLTEQQAILAAQDADFGITANTPTTTPPVSPGTNQQATLAKAQAQATLSAQQKQANQGDWRVKLRLAPGANYLYRANDGKGTQAGILQPLAVTDGVVFPYTPVISTNYRANYNTYDLTHSNYRGYFYQGSTVEEITIQATFTAQDTYEANYLLAVIHFFKSVTKMFYGQDAERGTPPPLVYLQGLGEYQFNLHPTLVTSFNYTLPNDVDYIRARSPNIDGTNLLQARQRQTVASNPFSEIIQRLQNAGLPRGGLYEPPPAPTLGTNSPTYVPTKLDMTITLLPVQSREQQSKQFSLKQYANGDLLKGGFW